MLYCIKGTLGKLKGKLKDYPCYLYTVIKLIQVGRIKAQNNANFLFPIIHSMPDLVETTLS